jgi:hypothetical protein
MLGHFLADTSGGLQDNHHLRIGGGGSEGNMTEGGRWTHRGGIDMKSVGKR